MKPAPFAYHAPDTLDEALDLLAQLGDDAKALAGGQSLIPMMNMRLAQPQALIDVCRVPELAGIALDGALAIKAATRQAAVLRSPEVAAAAPLLGAALRHVGHPANRSRGTFGGSVAHADPAAELPSAVLALDAQLVVRGPRGERVVAADDFFTSYFSTALDADELLTEIRLPLPGPGERTAWAFAELARRHGDFAIAGVALAARVGDDDVVTSARIALLGVADVPARARAAEALLAGRRLDEPELARAAGAVAAEGLAPPDDLHGSAQYRLDVTRVLVRRAIEQSAGRERAAA
ncbi:MAG TPA: xanthine dehydrogenase family protein subunit M [Conexibacter sp.]|nr:xanthine dehydrogenase family protein subunit M [Conexibacter sp.]